MKKFAVVLTMAFVLSCFSSLVGVAEGQSAYLSFTGQVASQDEIPGMIRVIGEEEAPFDFMINENVLVIDNAGEKTDNPEVGDTITGYYPRNSIMLMIYPPRITPTVVVVHNEDIPSAVMVDAFNDDLINAELSLRIAPSDEETTIVSVDGSEYDGELTGKNLICVYEFVGTSQPGFTTPSKIIVLGEAGDVFSPENNQPQIPGLQPEYLEEQDQLEPQEGDAPIILSDSNYSVTSIDNVELIVDGVTIDAPKAYYNQDGYLMLPLRAIAEALSYEVAWDGPTQTISVGTVPQGINVTIGKDYYTFARMAPFYLGAAPELIGEGITYVPASFFEVVLRATITGENQLEISR